MSFVVIHAFQVQKAENLSYLQVPKPVVLQAAAKKSTENDQSKFF